MQTQGVSKKSEEVKEGPSFARHEGKWRTGGINSVYSLISALDTGGRSVSRPGRLPPRTENPVTRCTECLVRPRAGQNALENR